MTEIIYKSDVKCQNCCLNQYTTQNDKHTEGECPTHTPTPIPPHPLTPPPTWMQVSAPTPSNVLSWVKDGLCIYLVDKLDNYVRLQHQNKSQLVW